MCCIVFCSYLPSLTGLVGVLGMLFTPRSPLRVLWKVSKGNKIVNTHILVMFEIKLLTFGVLAAYQREGHLQNS